ncbi:MAG: HU family DNA-binding protein [Acidobacteria bacterium]|nr:HU family DNA-binding protein [Acidobacteriota bacterium]
MAKKAVKKKAAPKKAAPKKAAPKAAPAAKKAVTPLTQTQVVTALAEKCDVNKKVAKTLLDELGALAIAETKRSGKFVLPGLGRFVKSERKARTGRNPATGATIKIPARTVVKFRVAKAAADAIVPAKKK